MTEPNASIAELEDRDGVVYVLGIGPDISESVTEWMYSDGFEKMWDERFDHATYMILPVIFEGVIQVEADSVDEVREVLEGGNENE